MLDAIEPSSGQVTEPEVWMGRFFGGRSATSETASARFQGASLVLHVGPGQVPCVWAISRIELLQGQFPGQRTLIRHAAAPDEWLTIDTAGFVDAWARRSPLPLASRGPRSRKGWALAAVASLGGIAAITAMTYAWLLPAAVALAAPHVPSVLEERLGTMVLPTVVQANARMEGDEDISKALNGMVAMLPGGGYHYRIVLNNDFEPNAAALPGGTIVVNRGLMLIANTPEEVMGVLAHEVAHVKLRHTTRAVLHGLGLQFVVSTLTGDATLGTLAWTLGALHHSREAESEADREALVLLRAAQVDPHGLVDFFERLETLTKEGDLLPAYVSTHPATPDRLRALHQWIRQNPYKPKKVRTTVPWDDIVLRMALSGVDLKKPESAGE